MILKGCEKRLFKRLPPKRYMYMYGLNERGEQRQVTVLGKEHEYSRSIWNAVRTTYQVCSSEGSLFWIERKPSGTCDFLRASPIGLDLLHVLKLPFDDIEATLPDHQKNPLFDLLRKCSCDHISDSSTLHAWKLETNDNARVLLASLIAIVHDLREGWKSKEVQDAFETMRRRSDKRWKKTKSLVSEAFEDCASVLPIRVDLHFLMPQEDYPFVPPVSAAEAHTFMVKMERYLREHHPLLRYAWTREYGTETGFHFHLLVLLNGHIAQEGISTAKLIGEQWQQHITEGRGRYFNCNAIGYKTPVLSRIHFSNKLAIKALLEESGWYLAKTDIWMQYKGAGRSFATSRRYKQRSPGGAKRKLPD